MSVFWLKLPLGIFECPETVALLKSKKGKEIFLFYLFLLCHSAGNYGYLSLADGTPMPLRTVSLLFYRSERKVLRYFSALVALGLVKETKKGYFVQKASDYVGIYKNGVRRKEEEEKEIEIDRESDKEKEKEQEKAKAKEKRGTRRYGNFDAEAVFAARIADFQSEAEARGWSD